jgi:dihydroorotase
MPSSPKEANVIRLRRPDDWHLHLRDGAMLALVLPFSARQFARAIVMPNLVPPVTTVEAALAYRRRILAALPQGALFTPLLTSYLTDATDPAELARGWAEGAFIAAKLYPAGATTHSDLGVSDVARIMPVLERMAALAMPLLVHGEVADPEIDLFDREAVFIERVLDPLRRRLPELKIVFEHVTSEEAVRYVAEGGLRIAATITAHHLAITRNALFAGGVRPHLYCLPIAKREKDRQALRRAATSGDPHFFLGTDSAPHGLAQKEGPRGAAGIFTAPAALELYAEAFEEEGAPDRLEAFASLHGPRFYGLPVNETRVRLVREPFLVPPRVGEGRDAVIPFRAGESLRWRLAG